MECVLQLVNNPIDVFDETTRLLLKIADNVITSPTNPKVRVLQKSNETIKKKILNVKGGIACLKAMGFQESDQTFSLPPTDSLSQIKQMRAEINRLKNGEKSSVSKETIAVNDNIPKCILVNSIKKTEEEQVQNTINKQIKNSTEAELVPENFKRIVLPSYSSILTNPFLKEIELLSHKALYYENKYLQQRALSVIPLSEIDEKAQNALRNFQLKVKQEKHPEPNINLQDFQILELLAWFKSDFFEWVDNPPCKNCNGKTKFSHMSTDKDLLLYTERIEMHKCPTCNTLSSFPRYNDLNILLETRKGRCGEWANVFTLMCRAMHWDARYVVDQSDHVWTEVYSFSQRRWLHCDPCENVCDKPLIYESGWKKKLSYVIAYSAEEVQDVTWRYSSQHKEVLKRRKECPEEELVEAISTLREIRQSSMSASRREYLTKRFLTEVIEMMFEKKPDVESFQGRSSGSVDWRVSRGEIQESKSSQFVWEFNTNDVASNRVCVQYSSALNQYHKISGNGKAVLPNWNDGVYQTENIFRKVETDWKKVYICCTESSTSGYITWKFKITDQKYSFATFDYFISKTLFQNGAMAVKLCSNDQCVLLTTDQGTTKNFSDSKEITVTVNFMVDNGSTAWQHAQLCREDLNGNEFTLKFGFTFMKHT